MLARLPAKVRTPAVARAMFSESATLLAGAGMAAAVLAGAPVAAAVAVGALAWLGRVAMAVKRTPRDERVDPGSLTEPWRSFVLDAQRAEERFGLARRRTRPGPLQDRLADLGRQVDNAVVECWRIARQGEVLSGAFSALDVAQVKSELQELLDEPQSTARDEAAAALEAQLDAAGRIARVTERTRDQLRVLNARLDEAVARAVELSVGTMSDAELNGVSDQVDSVVTEMEAVRQALEETA
jgi:hypothetical protein